MISKEPDKIKVEKSTLEKLRRFYHDTDELFNKYTDEALFMDYTHLRKKILELRNTIHYKYQDLLHKIADAENPI